MALSVGWLGGLLGAPLGDSELPMPNKWAMRLATCVVVEVPDIAVLESAPSLPRSPLPSMGPNRRHRESCCPDTEADTNPLDNEPLGSGEGGSTTTDLQSAPSVVIYDSSRPSKGQGESSSGSVQLLASKSSHLALDLKAAHQKRVGGDAPSLRSYEFFSPSRRLGGRPHGAPRTVWKEGYRRY